MNQNQLRLANGGLYYLNGFKGPLFLNCAPHLPDFYYTEVRPHMRKTSEEQIQFSPLHSKK